MSINQKRILFVLLTLLSSLFIHHYFNFGSFELTRKQLEILYQTNFEDCEIEALISSKYSGRGNYKLFKVDCEENYHPILLQRMDAKALAFFEPGATINKEKKSYAFKITSGKQGVGVTHQGSFRAQEEEKDDLLFKFVLPIVLGMFISACFVLLL